MKKTVKQIMACVLAAVMIASTTGMPVLAEEAATEAPAQEDPEGIEAVEQDPEAADKETADKEAAKPDIKAEEESAVMAAYNYTYDRNAMPLDKDRLPGVYVVKAVPGDKKDSTKLGMPSIAKQNLESGPTTESPAIIQGAAVPFERRADIGGEIHFDKISEDPICAPYSYFRYELVEEANTGTTPEGASHTKITGFDGTFVILRIDVSDIIKNAPAGSYLHVKQSDNKAMYVLYGQGEMKKRADDSLASVSFSDSKGQRVGCYSLDDAAAALKDTDGYYRDTPYIDIIMVSSGTIVAGADKGKANAPSADFPVSMYVDQTPDYNPEIIWDEATKSILNRDTREPVAGSTDSAGNAITPDMMMLDKYYDESKSGGATVTGYTIEGDDLELEVTVDESEGGTSTPAEYWSLRRAMAYNAYNSHTIKLMCEVPVLQGLLLEGDGRDVILDVNSFDIQIANHTDTKAAGLTVRDNAKLTIADHSNTTGAELAVGNNATMLVEDGGKLVIDRTCQLEVEYDSGSTAVPAEGETPPPAEELNYGVIKIINGGEIINNGVITVEGAEGKAQDATEVIIRDYKDAKLTVGDGGTLTNHGCLLVNGSLYNLGTIVNDGKYDVDPIISTDPDKGNFTYHRGIQLSWKDDVTQGQTSCGYMAVGMDEDEVRYPNAKLVNSGDIVAIPGYILNRATVENSGNIFLTAVDEVIIPVVASQDQSTVVEKKIKLGYFEISALVNDADAVLKNAAGGSIRTADFEIKSNGRTGDMTREISSDYEELDIFNIGTLENAGNISVSAIYSPGDVTNSGTVGTTFGSDTVSTSVILQDMYNSKGSLEDTAATKLTTVYNGAKTVEAGTNKWNYAELDKLKVTTVDNSKFDITATPVLGGEDIIYLVETVLDNEDKIVSRDPIPAGTTVTITPDTTGKSGNRIYTFQALGTEVYASASIDKGSTGVERPTAMQDLVYDGTAQKLVTVGSSPRGKVRYSLDNINWSDTVPEATAAGTYTVNYRVVDDSGAEVSGLGGSVNAVIAKRALYIAADDKGTKKGEALKELTFTAYGLMDADKDKVNITSNANKDTAGVYDINISIADDVLANYNTVDNEGKSTVTGGKYFVSERFLNLDIKSSMGGYMNMNQSVVITAAKYKRDETKTTETVANIYYSTKTALNESNYKDEAAGSTTIAPSYAAVGTNVTVYYYVEIPAEGGALAGFAGSQRIVINKGDQLRPGLVGEKVGVDNTVQPPKDIMGVLETVPAYKGGKGAIFGLECPGKDATTTHPMEYRRSDSDKYIAAVRDYAYLPVGTYYVRKVEDEHYNPGPDTQITITEDGTYTAVFYNGNGKELDRKTGIEYGSKIPMTDKIPTRSDGAKFRAWQSDDRDYDFDQPYVGNLTVSNGIISFYPDWETVKHTVTFDLNGAGTNYTVKVEDGASVESPKDPKYTGHTLLGWKSGDSYYDFKSKVTSDLTLVADWKINAATIRFIANGAGGSMADMKVEFGQTVNLTANAYTWADHTFMNWTTESDGRGTAYADSAKFTNSEPADGTVINLYAQWKKSLDNSNISVKVADCVYDGTAQRPQVSVYDTQPGGTVDITRYCNIEYSDNTNAGTAKVTVTATAGAPYRGSRVQTFTISKAGVTLTGTSAGRAYESGNRDVDVTLSIKDGVIEADKPYVALSATEANAVMADPYAGENKMATIEYSGISLTGEKAANYYIEKEKDSVSVTITKRGAEPVLVPTTATYLASSGKVTDTMELGWFLVEDLGEPVFDTASVTHTGVIGSASVNEAGTLTYTVVTNTGGEGEASVTVHSGNYEDLVITMRVRVTDMELYEKNGERCEVKTIAPGKSFTLEPRFSSAATDKRFIWGSSNPGVASVGDGKVTGISSGTSVITAYNHDTGLFADCMVMVYEPVEEITADKSKVEIGTGEKWEVTATVLPYSSAQGLEWKSSDESVATVSGDGSRAVITGAGAGKAKITATAVDGSGKSVVINVTVGAPVSPITVSSKGNASAVAVGKKLQMSATFASKPANNYIYWKATTVDGEDASAIATLSEKGVLEGVSEGVVRVTATSLVNETVYASKDITVYVPVKSAKLNTTSAAISLASGANGLDLSTTITPALSKDSVPGTQATGVQLGTLPTVRYSVDSKYTDYLNVDATTGMVTAKGKAAKNIPVYANIKAFGGYDKTLTCKVTVTDKANPLKKVKFNKSSVVVGTGKTMYLDAVMTPLNPDGAISAGLAEGCNPSLVSYEGSTIVGGHILFEIKAKSAVGDETLTFGVTSSTGTATVKCKVKVLPSVTAIDFRSADMERENSLATGKSIKLKYEFEMSPVGRKAADTSIIWKSSDPSVATVNSKGTVKGVGSGTVTITAVSAADETVKTDLKFRVYNPVKKLKADRKKLVIDSSSSSAFVYGKVAILPGCIPDDHTLIEWKPDNDNVALAYLSSGTPAASAKYGEPGASALTTKNDMLAVKGLKPGVTNITGTAQDGSGKKIKISVTVRGDVTAMTMDENVTVKAGGSYTLTPEFTINGVTSANPKLYKSYMKYTDTKVSYWSSSEDVTVSAKGKITVKKGTSVRSATITAFTADGNDAKKRIVNVTIQ